jgi:hypothetical protein
MVRGWKEEKKRQGAGRRKRDKEMNRTWKNEENKKGYRM